MRRPLQLSAAQMIEISLRNIMFASSPSELLRNGEVANSS